MRRWPFTISAKSTMTSWTILTSSLAIAASFLWVAPISPLDVIGVNRNEIETVAIGSIFASLTMIAMLIIAEVAAVPPPTLPKTLTMEPNTGNPNGLAAKEILKMSFDYATETAEQAMEHRLTIVNFYLLVVGGAGSAVVALLASTNNSANLTIGAIGLLWLVSLIGWLTLLKLIRLRAAWVESAVEMNAIKNFYLHNAKDYSIAVLASAFTFMPTSIPPAAKRWNVFYYSALLVALLDSGSFLGGFLLTGLHSSSNGLAIVPGAVFTVLLFLGHTWVYDIMLNVKPKQAISQQPAPATVTAPQRNAVPVPTAALQNTSFFSGVDAAQSNEVISTKDIYTGKIVHLTVEDIRLPDGSSSVREIVHHDEAVVIIAYLEATQEVLFIEQYRDAVKQSLLELPAGMLNAGENPETTAHRELLEETGYSAGTLRHIGTYFTSPGFTNEKHHLFMATNLTQVSGIQDVQEIHAVHPIRRSEAMTMVENGTIIDGKTITGLLWTAPYLPTDV